MAKRLSLPAIQAIANSTTQMISSIIICTYNHLRDLTVPCIDRILSSTSSPFELVLIDDGSDDNSFAYFKQVSRKAYRNRQNLGVAKSRNKGMRSAKGGILIFIDNDVLVTPGWLRILLEEHGKHRVGIVGGIPSNERFRFALPLSADGLIDYPQISGACFSFKRQVMDRIGFMDESLVNCGEDTDYCFRALLAGFRVCSTPRVVVQHRHYATRRDLDQGKILECVDRFRRKWARYSDILPLPGAGVR